MRSVDKFQSGAFYSNGDFGNSWQVRQIISIDGTDVRYKVVSGEGRRQCFTCSQCEFGGWARHEVDRDENSWRIKRESSEVE